MADPLAAGGPDTAVAHPASGPRATVGRPVERRHLDAPFHVDALGHAARTGDDDHIRDLIRAVLFTEPGERVNRPEFGCALRTLLFMPNSDVLAAATRTLVLVALQRWLALEIVVDDVRIEAVESELRVTVVYRRRVDTSSQTASFAPAGGTGS
jgi:phage baseplate assembly protein W